MAEPVSDELAGAAALVTGAVLMADGGFTAQ